MAEPLDAAAGAVGDRWALLVCDALRAGPLRFADLQQQVAAVSPTVLTRRLRDLEAAGLVVAEPYSDRPVRHRYRLTELGRSLGAALDALARWGELVLAAADESGRSGRSGTAGAGEPHGAGAVDEVRTERDLADDGGDGGDDDGDEVRYA